VARPSAAPTATTVPAPSRAISVATVSEIPPSSGSRRSGAPRPTAVDAPSNTPARSSARAITTTGDRANSAWLIATADATGSGSASTVSGVAGTDVSAGDSLADPDGDSENPVQPAVSRGRARTSASTRNRTAPSVLPADSGYLRG
jgi:hypothetical protein